MKNRTSKIYQIKAFLICHHYICRLQIPIKNCRFPGMKIFQYLQGHITYAQYLLYGKNISFLHILFQRSAMYIFHDDVTKVTPLCVINHLWQIGMFKKSEQSGLSSAAGRQLFYRTKMPSSRSRARYMEPSPPLPTCSTMQ